MSCLVNFFKLKYAFREHPCTIKCVTLRLKYLTHHYYKDVRYLKFYKKVLSNYF